jgi:hypothetical protein
MSEDLFLKRGATYAGIGRYRLTLDRSWDETKPCVCYIGHNPSTAGHELEDPTSLAWLHFARLNGFGRYVAVNLYPLRTSDPEVCRRWANWEANGPDWEARDALLQNLAIVVATAKAADLVVASWGAIARDLNWIELVVEEIQRTASAIPLARNLRWLCVPFSSSATVLALYNFIENIASNS